MTQTLKSLVIGMFAMVCIAGCSTSAVFRIPEGQTLKVTDRTVVTDAQGVWKTSPFFWSVAGGAPYRLIDKDGNIVRQGELKTKFRVVSIFWPPYALIYWPMGLDQNGYDLTKPGDGYQVRDNTPPMIARPAAVPAEEAVPVKEAVPLKKPKKK